MTLKEFALIVVLSVVVHLALEAAECAIWSAYNRLYEWMWARRKGRRK